MRSYSLLQPPSAHTWPKKYCHASCYRSAGVFEVLLAFRHTVSRQGRGQALKKLSIRIIELIRAFSRLTDRELS